MAYFHNIYNCALRPLYVCLYFSRKFVKMLFSFVLVKSLPRCGFTHISISMDGKFREENKSGNLFFYGMTSNTGMLKRQVYLWKSREHFNLLAPKILVENGCALTMNGAWSFWRSSRCVLFTVRFWNGFRG